MAQTVNSLPAMQETWVLSLGWEDLLEKGMATRSSILAWRNPMERRTQRATVHGVTKNQTRLSFEQVNMVDEAKLCGPIRSAFEVLIVWPAVGYCCGELGSFC